MYSWSHSLFILTLFLCSGFVVAAQEFPSKPVKIIVPFPAGSSADVRTRQLAPLVAERLMVSVLVDNRPGAAGNIGAAIGAKSAPDGHTVIYIHSGIVATNPHLYKDMGFDPRKDIVPFILMNRGSAILVVRAASPFNSLQSVIDHARANPGKLTYGTSGPGSPQHLMGERLKHMAGIDLVQVPYKGDAPTLLDLMGGQIDMAFGFPLATMPHIKAGKLRALAVASAKRIAPLPNTPSISEAGVPGYDESIWTGFALPSGTPETIAKKLHEVFRSAMRTPAFQRDTEKSGAELIASTQPEAVQMMKTDYERYGKIVKELGLRIE